MKFHRIIHRILLMIGVALGIVTTGATANAKAQQVNANNTQNNNSSNQYINHNQFSSNTSRLVNRLESSPVVNNSSYESMSASPSSSANVGSSYNYDKSSVNYQTSSSASGSGLKLSERINRSNNYDNNHTSVSKSLFHTKLNHVYRNILSDSRLNMHKNLRSKTNLNHSTHVVHHQHARSWFKDGLNSQNLKARSWVSWHESNHRWRVLSYGGVCVGYFQLSPRYLGYRNGHVDLRPEHQVKVADQYVQKRYGSWVNAKRFWVFHHWY